MNILNQNALIILTLSRRLTYNLYYYLILVIVERELIEFLVQFLEDYQPKTYSFYLTYVKLVGLSPQIRHQLLNCMLKLRIITKLSVRQCTYTLN